MKDSNLFTSSKKRLAVLIASFFALTFFTYLSSINNEFVHFDDDILIFNNPAVQEFSPESIKWVFSHFDPELYIPLTFLSYQLDHLIGGLNPTIFHLHNLILHTLNALFVCWLIFLISKRTWLALFCGLLFAVHPLHTETVIWASARKDVLSTLFFLLTIITYIYHQNENSKRWYVFSLGLFTLGLLAKVSIVILPVLLILLDYRNNIRINKHSLIPKIPFILLSVLFGIIAIFGKQSVLSNSPLAESILMAGKSTVFYLQKFILPTNLSVIYPYNEQISISSLDFLIPLIILFVISILVFLSTKKTKEVLFGALFFFIALMPSFSNYAKAGDIFFASDRYAYIPSIGIFYIVGIAFLFLFNRFRKIAISLFIGIIITFSILSSSQAEVWKNTSTLFSNVISKFDYSHMAHNKVGANLLDQNKVYDALKSFKRSIELKPNARAYYNLCLTYITLEQYDYALDACKKSVELNSTKMDAQYNLGFLYLNAGQNDSAIERFLIVHKNNPKDIDALTSLTVLYIKIGDLEEAKIYINKILEIDPKNKDANTLLQKIN